MGVGSLQADADGGQSLLSIEECPEFRQCRGLGTLFLPFPFIEIVFIVDLIETEFAHVLLLDLPDKKSADRVIIEDGIEQHFDAVGFPFEFPLDGGQANLVTFDLSDDLQEVRVLVRHTQLSFWQAAKIVRLDRLIQWKSVKMFCGAWLLLQIVYRECPFLIANEFFVSVPVELFSAIIRYFPA